MTGSGANHRQIEPGLLPISKPSEYMEAAGVHPHISHEHDIPAMVAKMVSEVDRLGREVERYYDADKNTTWREYAKALAVRLSAQRKEIHRLHRKVRELRADVHFAQEQAEDIDAKRCEAVNAERACVDHRDRYLGVIDEALARTLVMVRNGELDEIDKSVRWLHDMCKEAQGV